MAEKSKKDESCICDRLRACEQRVLNTAEQAILAKVHQNPTTPIQIAENSGLGMAWSVIDELLGRQGQVVTREINPVLQRVADLIHVQDCGCEDGPDDDNFSTAEQIIDYVCEVVAGAYLVDERGDISQELDSQPWNHAVSTVLEYLKGLD